MRPRPRLHGFTLLELIVVIAIIATLVSVVAPQIFNNVGDAKISAAKSQIEAFGIALEAYRMDNDLYPSTEQGLRALREQPLGGDPPRNWRGPYIRRAIPRDPWGRPYSYISPGLVDPTGFDLYSLGRDGRIGGSGEDRDITASGDAVREQ